MDLEAAAADLEAREGVERDGVDRRPRAIIVCLFGYWGGCVGFDGSPQCTLKFNGVVLLRLTLLQR